MLVGIGSLLRAKWKLQRRAAQCVSGAPKIGFDFLQLHFVHVVSELTLGELTVCRNFSMLAIVYRMAYRNGTCQLGKI
jgi:hypothetical protein